VAGSRSRSGRTLAVGPGWQDDSPSHPVAEIAIYPVVWLAAHSLRALPPEARQAILEDAGLAAAIAAVLALLKR
jgi:hypothetical protein